MRNIEKNSIKHLAIQIIAIALIGIILYPIFDLIICKLKIPGPKFNILLTKENRLAAVFY